MKRVAYVCADPGVAVFGAAGSAVRIQHMLRALQTLGAQVQLFAAQLGGARPSGLEHVRVHNLSPLPKAHGPERERAALRGNAELRWLLEDNGPFDAIYERYSLWSYAGMETAAAVRSVGVLEVSGALIEEAVARRALADRETAEQVARRAFSAAGALLVGSRKIASYLHHRFPQTCSRITVVPPALDPMRFPPRAQPFERRRAGAFTIASVGTIEPPHGDVLLDAFAQVRGSVPGARLLITGIAENDVPRGSIVDRGLEAAVEIVPLANGDRAELLDRCDVAVAHDAYGDASIAPYECMAAGVPVVASRSREPESLIEDGSTGLLCSPGDAGALARAIELLAGNPLLRARLGSEGRAHALKRYSWNAAAERVLNLTTTLGVPVPAA